MDEFVAWPKTPRLNRDCIITEKLDGTNSQILIDDGVFRSGSRNRWLTLGDDNYGFARWAFENQEQLTGELGPGRHYGEWWGGSIQRGYGVKEKSFSLFNAKRWAGAPLELCKVAPVLYEGLFSTQVVDGALAMLRAHGSMAAPGYMKPEGVIVFHIAAQQAFKAYVE